VSAEDRVAPATFVRTGAAGEVARGEGVARVDDAALSVGTVRVAHLDADALRAADYAIEIDVWPQGTLVLSGLGRRYDAFVRELTAARSRARVAGLLAHGITPPEPFQASVLEGPSTGPAQIELYDTHITVVPERGDPWQVPLGALTELEDREDPPAIAVSAYGGRTVLGMLGRQRGSFRDAVLERRDGTARSLHAITGHDGFRDGLGLTADRIGGFQYLLGRVTSSEREECARTLMASATAPARLGFVQLLDPDGEGLAAPEGLTAPWASFLLVPVGTRVVLEMLAGPQAATYVFQAPLDAVNEDLQALHFRRAPLALTESQAELAPTNPHRLALRKLEPLRRLRAATAARLIHKDGWKDALQVALA
jgi:hypothetical protein